MEQIIEACGKHTCLDSTSLKKEHVSTRYNSTEVKYPYFRLVLDYICT